MALADTMSRQPCPDDDQLDLAKTWRWLIRCHDNPVQMTTRLTWISRSSLVTFSLVTLSLVALSTSSSESWTGLCLSIVSCKSRLFRLTLLPVDVSTSYERGSEHVVFTLVGCHAPLAMFSQAYVLMRAQRC